MGTYIQMRWNRFAIEARERVVGSVAESGVIGMSANAQQLMKMAIAQIYVDYLSRVAERGGCFYVLIRPDLGHWSTNPSQIKGACWPLSRCSEDQMRFRRWTTTLAIFGDPFCR